MRLSPSYRPGEGPVAMAHADTLPDELEGEGLTPAHGVQESARGRPRPGVIARGLVESVRVIVVALGAVAGWQIAAATGRDATWHLVLGIVLGSAVGYVTGGVIGRSTATAVTDLEREMARLPAADLLAGTFGLFVGIALATLVSLPLFHLPNVAAYTTVAFAYASFGYAGMHVARNRSEELLALFGVKPRAAGTRDGEVSILDSSALLDGRILPLVQLGFLGGTTLLAQSVLEELQAVADSSDPARRARGRRGLDTVVTLKRDPRIDMILVRDAPAPGEPVDSQLLRLARERGGVLVTNDSGLATMAQALEVPVRSIHVLAEAMRAPVVAGEQVPVRLLRRGRDAGQAVAYLDDGTMVVVEGADGLIGQTVDVLIKNAIRTSSGQMVFAVLADPRSDEAL